MEILRPGLKMLEDLVHKPVLGVVPMLQVDIDEEDSLSSKLDRTAAVKALDLAVIRLPRLSNFTDFDALERFDCAGVRYVHSAAELGNPDLILLPGTKNTMDDLLWMRQNGLEGAICKLHRSGTPHLRHLRRLSNAGARSCGTPWAWSTAAPSGAWGCWTA